MKKLVIIDNDRTVADIYRNKFREEGFHVELARDGKSGLAMIMLNKPDAVLMEFILPELSGEEVIRQLRGKPDYEKLPIVIATHCYSGALLEKAWDVGADEVLTKAVHTPPQVFEAVLQAIEMRKNSVAEAGISPSTESTPAPVDAAAHPNSTAPSLTAPPAFVWGKSVREHASPQAGQAIYQKNVASLSVETQPPSKAALPVLPSGAGAQRPLNCVPEAKLAHEIPQAFLPVGDLIDVESHIVSQAGLLQAFLKRVPALMAGMRATLARFIECPTGQVRLSHLIDLQDKARAFSVSCSMAGLPNIQHSAGILERLAEEVCEKPALITSSVIHTLAQGIDLVAWQLKHTANPALDTIGCALILVLEDNEISWLAICSSLSMARFHPIVVCDEITTSRILEKNPLDLVVLDLDAAHVNGFELCERMRHAETNKDTPVIFLASSIDLEMKSKIALCGASELVMKPFLFNELALKAYLLVQKHAFAR